MRIIIMKPKPNDLNFSNFKQTGQRNYALVLCKLFYSALFGSIIIHDNNCNYSIILFGRLGNEITRLSCVRALTTIVRSPLNIDVSMILPETVPLLTSFLRKNQRALKLASVTLLNTLALKVFFFQCPL